MKTLTKFVVAFIFLIAASQLQAQVKFGPEVGINFSQLKVSGSGTSITTSSVTSFHLGMDVEFGLAKNFFLQSGLMYSGKGGTYNGDQVSLSYVELPFNFMYKFDISGPKILVLAGPYIAYAVGGEEKYGGVSTKIHFGNTTSDNIKPLDFGLNFGLGAEFNGLVFTGKYELGLTNLIPGDTGGVTEKLGVFELSLAYMFGGK